MQERLNIGAINLSNIAEVSYRNLVEQIPAIAYIDSADVPGKTLYISPQLVSLLGFTQAEWCEGGLEFWYLHIYPEDRDQARKELLDRMSRKKPYCLEYRMVSPDGRVIWFRDEAVIKQDPDTGVSVYLGIMLDITDRKMAEARLRESEKRYRDLFENSQGFICIHDMDGVLTSVNRASAQMLEYEPSELIGRNLCEFLAPSVRHLFPYYLERIAKESTPRGILRTITKSGEERIWTYRNVRCEEAGKGQYILGHAQDVTERILAQEELNRATMLLISLLDNLPTGVLVEDHSGRIHYINNRFCQMCDLAGSPDDLVGTEHYGIIQSIKNLFPDPEAFVRRDREIHDLHQTVTEERLPLGDGRMFQRDYFPVQTN